MCSAYSSLRSARLEPPSRLIKLVAIGAGILGIGLTGCGQSFALTEQATSRSNEGAAEPVLPQPVLSQSGLPPSNRSAIADAEALVALGPRVAGTPAAQQASRYLEAAFQQAGYLTEVQVFTYPRFVDRGSTLTVNNSALAGQALNGTIPGNVTAPLVAIPGVGRAEDFAQVDARGAIAIVQRGTIRFLEKANNAATAGASGLVIVNSQDDSFRAALGGEAAIPVLSLSGEAGRALLSGSISAPVTLNVNAARESVTGRNVIARPAGVTQPDVLLGAHYDSVAGSPGANDNASGTAVLLDLARQLPSPMSRRAWFVAFDGEEDGLQGSRAFVRQAAPEFLGQLRGMLNFDMVGVNDGLQVSGAAALTQLAAAVDAAIMTVGENGNSDHAAFAAANVPVLFFTRGMEPNYHSPRDRQVTAELLNQTTQIALALLNRLLSSRA